MANDLDQRLAERAKLNRQYHGWFREQIEAVRQGPYGTRLEQLRQFLDRMTPDDGAELIALVRRQGWHRAADDTRYLVLRVINNSILLVREKHGLPPFDDALDDEAPTLSQIVKQTLYSDAGDAAPTPSDPSAADNEQIS
jgi:hypothetical protein